MRVSFLVAFMMVLLISSSSALTDEEREKNNRLIERGIEEEVEPVGVVGVVNEEGNFEINPFIIIGLGLAILLLCYIIFRIVRDSERI